MRRRSSWIAALIVFSSAVPALAQRGDDAQRQSKNGRLAAQIGGVGVVVLYGRPEVRGRKVWGELVPFDRVWRTGADEATTITVDRDAEVGGQRVAAGTYALFTIPGDGEWTVILNRGAKQWGAFKYDAGQDVARVAVQPRSGSHVEALDFTPGEDEILLRWERLRVPIPIRVAP